MGAMLWFFFHGNPRATDANKPAADIIAAGKVLVENSAQTHSMSRDAFSSAASTDTASARDQTILELFSPSDPYLTKQLNETALAQQIEQIMTTSFVLTKCEIIDQDDYGDNFRALITYAMRMKLAPDAAVAEARVRQIAESASASYALVYSRTKCDSPQLPILAEQLLTWQKAYLDN